MSREAVGEQFDVTLLSAMDSMKGAVAGGEVVSEPISGDRATVTLRAQSGAEVVWRCVKQADGWRVAVGG